MISSIANFCERALFAINDYPSHIVYSYDEKKKIFFMHYNFKCICPFDIIEELDSVKLEFEEMNERSTFYVRQRELEIAIDGFKFELEFLSIYLGKK